MYIGKDTETETERKKNEKERKTREGVIKILSVCGLTKRIKTKI
jgi:hypothetical protein